MIDFFIYILAILITVPPVLALIVYYFSLKRFHSTMRAVHATVRWTTLFFIVAVDLLISVVFNISATGGIIVALLILLTLIIYYQWKNTEIRLRKALRLLWRITFLLFFVLYLLLLLAGVVKQIVF